MNITVKSRTNNTNSEQTLKTLKEIKHPVKPRIICDDEQYEIFQNLIRQRLIECGWAEEIKRLCKDVIKEKGSELTVPQLLEDVSNRAKNMLPMSIKKELLQKMKDQIKQTKTKSTKITKSRKNS